MLLNRFVLLHVYEEHYHYEDTDFVFVGNDALTEVRDEIRKCLIRHKAWLDSKDRSAKILLDEFELEYDDYCQHKDEVLDYVIDSYSTITYGDLEIEVTVKGYDLEE